MDATLSTPHPYPKCAKWGDPDSICVDPEGGGSKMRGSPLIQVRMRDRGWEGGPKCGRRLLNAGSECGDGGCECGDRPRGPGPWGAAARPFPPRIRSSLRRRKFITVTEKHKFYQFCVFLYQIKQLFTTSMFVFCSWRSPASFSIHSGES